MNSSNGHQIRWTDAEQAQILERAIPFYREHPTMTLGKIIKHAQQCLPADRQRKLSGFRQFGRWQDLLDSRNAPVVPAPVVEERIDISFVNAEPTDVLHTISTEALCGELLARLVKEVSAQMNDTLLQTLARISFSAGVQAPAPGAPKVRKKRIAVVGLLRDQYHHVLGRVNVPPGFELVYFDKDHKGQMPAVDFAIASKHAGSHWRDQSKQAAGRMFYVDGNVGAVADQIRKIFDDDVRG